MTVQTTGAGTESAERVADVLLAFARTSSSIGVSALARDLDLSKAVVHRILQSLVSRGLLQYSATGRDYSLGPSATVLGAKALRQLDVRAVGRDPLLRLRDTTGETTTLSLLTADSRAYVDQYESPNEIKMTVELGRMYPLHAGSSSRAILAHLPATQIEHIIRRGLDPLTSHTLTDADELRRQLEQVRRLGYARSVGERQAGAGSIASPVFGMRDDVIGSISVCGPLSRFDDEAVSRFIPFVVSTAREISQGMHATR